MLRFASSVMQRHCLAETLVLHCPSIYVCMRKKALLFANIFSRATCLFCLPLYCIIQSSLHAEPFIFFPFPPCMQNRPFVLFPFPPCMQNHLYVLFHYPTCVQNNFYSLLSFPACRTVCTLSYPFAHAETLVRSPIPPCMQNRLFSFQSFPSWQCTLY